MSEDDRVEVDGMELHLEPIDGEGEQHTALPPRLEAWRRRSATGALLTGIALGLQEALDPRAREETPIVVQTTGDPPEDLPVEADLSGTRPSEKVVTVRPWLLDGHEG